MNRASLIPRLEDDVSRRVRFDIASRREYLDLVPVLQRYRRTGKWAS